MACQRFAGRLRDVAAGREPTAELDAHLAQCAPCREVVAEARAFMATLDADLARELRVEPSPDFEARVRLRVSSEPASAGWFGGWRIGLAAAASLVVALAVIGLTVRWGGTPSGVSRAPQGSVGASGSRAKVPGPPGETAPSFEQTPVPDAASQSVPRVAQGVANRAGGRAQSSKASEPEVLVARDQQIVIARMLDALRHAKLDESAVRPAEPAELGPPPLSVQELSVPPIVIAPGGPEKQR